ncbi:unnamed protein product [Hermetia illucens]|uniref:Uncharacterized protein n=1 Tax=Hermetia illucens TaxID=343691 RepID=A0A7R8UID9_HERIL|nr:uncharacterized protein LOC119649174 [Hermetia illucens]CAD7081356.1 unnamed protein product [Hermetia illucens]
MVYSDRSNKAVRKEPMGPPQTDCTVSECSAGCCSSTCTAEENLDGTEPKAEGTALPEIEISSSTGNENDFYKMKADVKANHFTPGKIEFKRIKNKACKCLSLTPRKQKVSKQNIGNKLKFSETKALIESPKRNVGENATFLSRLKSSFLKMSQGGVQKENQSARSPSKRDPEKIDIYYFDHGNAAYFRTTDCPPTILSELLAQQTTYYATRFWAEIFGSLHIGVTFFITFFLQAYRFILYSVVRASIIGFFQMTSDYLLKPVLTVLFNGAIQPVLILVYNVLSSFKDMLEPIADTIMMFLNPVATLLKSIRLVAFNKKTIIYNEKKQDGICEDLEAI